MTAAAPGTPVTSTSANTQTNTSMSAAYPAASATADTLMVMEVSGDATGTGVAPTGMAATGWAKLGEKADTNTGTATSSSYVGVFWKVLPAGSASGNAPFTWTNAGQMVALCTPYTNFDPANPLPAASAVFAEKAAADTNYSISGTTGTDPGLLAYGFANRAGSTAFSALTDNARGSQLTLGTTGCTMIGRVTAAEVAGGTAFTKTATGTNTSVGVSWAYVVKGLTSVTSSRSTTWNVASGAGGLTSVTASRATSWGVAGPITASRATTWAARSRLSEWLAATPLYVAHRGGDNDWVEMTRDAYTRAIANGCAAINIDAVRCSTGEFVASHDTTTGRVFGTNLTIGSSTWSSLSGLTTTTGGFPIEKVADLLAAFPNVVVFVENKGNTSDDTALLDMLDAAGGGPARIVIKQYYTAATVATDAHARGYKTWGYYYAADLTNLAATVTRWDLLGLDYLDTNTTDWTSIKAYGKPVLGHVIPSAVGAAQAFSLGADGIMTGKVLGVVPGSVTSVTASRSTSWVTRSTALANRSTSWTAGTSLTISRATSWTAAGAVVSTRSTSWATAGTVTPTRATTWTAKTAVATSRGTSWATTAAVAGARSTSWTAAAGVSQFRPTTWASTAALTTGRLTTWTADAQATASRATSWNTAGSLVTVTSTRSATWSTAARATAARTTTWAATTAVSAGRSAVWVTAASASGQRSTSWDTGAAVSGTRASVWSVRAPAAGTRAAVWATYEALTADRPTSWSTAAAVTASRAGQWANLAPGIAVRVTSWSTRAPVTATRVITWTVSSNAPAGDGSAGAGPGDLTVHATLAHRRWQASLGPRRYAAVLGVQP